MGNNIALLQPIRHHESFILGHKNPGVFLEEKLNWMHMSPKAENRIV